MIVEVLGVICPVLYARCDVFIVGCLVALAVCGILYECCACESNPSLRVMTPRLRTMSFVQNLREPTQHNHKLFHEGTDNDDALFRSEIEAFRATMPTT